MELDRTESRFGPQTLVTRRYWDGGQADGSLAPAMPADGGYCGEHGFRASLWRNTVGFVLKAGRSPASRCPRELFEQVI
jgi:hypothetical protein